MPSLGADMQAGTVTRWLVKPGDQVSRGDVVAVVETEKSTIEVEIFESGTIETLLVHEGERVPVGTVLARVTQIPVVAPGVPAPQLTPSRHAPLIIDRKSTPTIATTPPALGPVAEHSPVTSPIVRHLAEQSGLDLAALRGTGPGGTVTRADVERAARRRQDEASSPQPTPRRPAIQRVARRQAPAAGRVRSSPLARRLANELRIDLTAVPGSGPHGSVIERDVRRFTAQSGDTGPAPATAEDRQTAMRRAIGALMARSKREIPHYYLSTTIDLTVAVGWLDEVNLARPVTERLVLPALLLKSTALAVRRVPEMNGSMVHDVFTASKSVHVGVAVSLRTGGVIAPAIHDVEQLTLDDLMKSLRDLVSRTRTGVLRSSEMSDPTITVTNLGELGVESVFGVIYPPQVALVGFGRLTERAVARDGIVSARPCVTASLSADHRVSDGHRGGRFLVEIDRLLQEPGEL